MVKCEQKRPQTIVTIMRLLLVQANKIRLFGHAKSTAALCTRNGGSATFSADIRDAIIIVNQASTQ